MDTKINWDMMGVVTSIGCAIHCALLPVVVSSLPVFGINIIHNLWFEWSMIGLAFVVGSYSLFHGYFKHHHIVTPLMLFFIGFAFLVMKQFFHPIENWFLLIAVPLIVWAHYNNYQLCHKSKCASPHHRH